MTPKTALKISAWVQNMRAGPGMFIADKFPVTVNLREHWAVKAKRTKRHRSSGKMVGMYLGAKPLMPGVTLRITLTRHSPKLADTDGNIISMKGLRDGIADAFGVTDGPDGPLTFEYKQAVAPFGCHGARVEIVAETL